ncbi:MAG: hypothetical protein JO269_03670 [Burkholderiaceae bacterium]|nr:hypothetical protein [Burkholderiaceae bacterium]
MLQHREIKKRFARIEREIEEAEIGCRSDATLPQQLKDCVMRWKRNSDEMKSLLDTENFARVAEYVDNMEQIGEQAETALRANVGVDDNLRRSVVHAHSELSYLKKKLH